MTVRKKIFIGCLAFVAIIVALGLFTRAQEQELGTLAMDVYDNALVGVTYAQQAQTDFVRLAAVERQSASPVRDAAARAKLDAVLSDIDVAQEQAVSQRGARLAAAVRSDIATLRDKPDRATLDGKLDRIDGELSHLVRRYRADGFLYRSRADRIIAQTHTALEAAIVLAQIVAVIITFLLGEMIVPPIRRAVEIAKAIANGRLDNRIDAKGRSETSVLLASLSSMQDAIVESAERARALQLSEAARLKAEYESVAAQKASHAKSEFLATMSHELRTPLNAILGFSDMIKEQMLGPIAPRYLDYARDIHISGRHLLDLINDVLDISKLEAGRFELHECPVDMVELVEAALLLVKVQARDGEVSLKHSAPGNLPCVQADGRLLKQVLLNLLSNAIKFTPRDGQVSVSLARITGTGVRVAISDTGIGMSEAEIAVALTPFGQIDSKIARERKGTGLGLPIAKSLIELHGGQFTVTSTPGLGTTVSFTLPEARIRAADATMHVA